MACLLPCSNHTNTVPTIIRCVLTKTQSFSHFLKLLFSILKPKIGFFGPFNCIQLSISLRYDFEGLSKCSFAKFFDNVEVIL